MQPPKPTLPLPKLPLPRIPLPWEWFCEVTGVSVFRSRQIPEPGIN